MSEQSKSPKAVFISNLTSIQEDTNTPYTKNQKSQNFFQEANSSTTRSQANTTTHKQQKLNDKEWQLSFILSNLEKIQNSEYLKTYPALLKLVFSTQYQFENHTKQIKLKVYKSLLHCSSKICERYFQNPTWNSKDKHIQKKLTNVLQYAQLVSILWEEELEEEFQEQFEIQQKKDIELQISQIQHLKQNDPEKYQQQLKQIEQQECNIDPKNIFKNQFLNIPSYAAYLASQLQLILNLAHFKKKCSNLQEYCFYLEKLKQFLQKFEDLIIKDFELTLIIDLARIEIANFYFIQQNYNEALLIYDITISSLQEQLKTSMEQFEITSKENLRKKKKNYHRLNKIVHILLAILLSYAEIMEYQKKYTKYHETVRLGIFLSHAFKYELQHSEELVQKFQVLWEQIQEYHHPCTNKIKSDGEIRKIMTQVFGKEIIELRIEEQENKLSDKDEIDQIMYKKYGYKELNKSQFIVMRNTLKFPPKHKNQLIDPNQYTSQRHKSRQAFFNSSGNARQSSNSQFYHENSIQSQSELDVVNSITQGQIQQFPSGKTTPKNSLQFQRQKVNPQKIGSTPFKSNQSYMNSIQETNASQQQLQSQQSEFQQLAQVCEQNAKTNISNQNNSTLYPTGSTMISPQSSTFVNQKKNLFTSPNNTNSANKANLSTFSIQSKKGRTATQGDQHEKPLVYISPNSKLQKHYYKDNSVTLKNVKILTTDKYWYPESMQKKYSEPFQNMTMLMKELPKQRSYFEYKVKPKLTIQNLNPEYLDLDVHFKQIIERKFNNQEDIEESDEEYTNTRKNSDHTMSRKNSEKNNLQTSNQQFSHSRFKSQPNITQSLPFFYIKEGLENISKEEQFDSKEFIFAKKQIKFRKTFTQGQRTKDIPHTDKTKQISKCQAYNEMETEAEFYESQLNGENKLQQYKEFKEQKKKEEIQRQLNQHALHQQQHKEFMNRHRLSHTKFTDKVTQEQNQNNNNNEDLKKLDILSQKSPSSKQQTSQTDHNFINNTKQEITTFVHKYQDENVEIDQQIKKLKQKTHFEEGYELKTIPTSARRRENQKKQFNYFKIKDQNPHELSNYVVENKFHNREQTIRNKQLLEINKLQIDANQDVNNYLTKNKIAQIGSNSSKQSKSNKLVQRLGARLNN